MTANSTPSEQLLQLLPDAVVQTDALWIITYLNLPGTSSRAIRWMAKTGVRVHFHNSPQDQNRG